MFCTNCGREIENGSIFCEFCGSKQEVSQEVSPELSQEIEQEPAKKKSFLRREKKRPKRRKKSKKPLIGGVFIFAMILAAVVLRYVPRFWDPGIEDFPNSNIEGSGNVQISTGNTYSLEDLITSDRWIVGPYDEEKNDFNAFEFFEDGSGVVEYTFLAPGTSEIPGWYSDKWDQERKRANYFQYTIKGDSAYLTFDGDESEIIMEFTLNGNDIIYVLLSTDFEGETYFMESPVYADPDLQ
ncbi:MAG: zinc ribbon domain-containing protein [Bacillota bacterium]|nr:zinc ribbon domain-containing protein [Bacillota bacterium]